MAVETLGRGSAAAQWLKVEERCWGCSKLLVKFCSLQAAVCRPPVAKFFPIRDLRGLQRVCLRQFTERDGSRPWRKLRFACLLVLFVSATLCLPTAQSLPWMM